MKIITWNVNGIRAALGKQAMEWAFAQNPDALCLQEVKARPGQLNSEQSAQLKIASIWNPAERPGYSGVVFHANPPDEIILGIGEPEFDVEGRVIQTRWGDLRLVRADRATNSLIVDAPAKRMAGFEQLVKSLDQQKLADNLSLRTYKVERADLASVANTIRQLLYGGSLTSKTSNAPITVSTEPVSRTLVVSGPSDIFEGVDDVLKRLDGLPQAAPTEMKLYALTAARADRLMPLVQRVLSQRARELRDPSGAPLPESATQVEVTSDAGSNTLVISAPREIMSVADGIMRALDQQSNSSALDVRVFRLSKGEAASIAGALRGSLPVQDKPGTNPATITPEPASNTVVIVGTSEQLDRAAKLIENLDQAVRRQLDPAFEDSL